MSADIETAIAAVAHYIHSSTSYTMDILFIYAL